MTLNSEPVLFYFRLLTFIIGLPLSQMILFCLAIGHYPLELPIGVVNYEVGPNNTNVLCHYNKNTCPQDPETWEWNLTRFSCTYLDYLSKRQHNLVSNCNFVIIIMKMS